MTNVECPKCKGNGGTMSHSCPKCGGSGKISASPALVAA